MTTASIVPAALSPLPHSHPHPHSHSHPHSSQSTQSHTPAPTTTQSQVQAQTHPQTHPHPHHRHRSDRSSTTPRPTSSRTPVSVGQPMPPFQPAAPRSPSRPSTILRTPSPNYFGLSVDPAQECMSAAGGLHARANWSSPTSAVRSTAAASPQIVPLDQKPEFDAFRKQSERAGFNSGSLSSFSMKLQSSARDFGKTGAMALAATSKPAPPSSSAKSSAPNPKSAETKQRSPKRMLSSPDPTMTDRPRRNSPTEFTDREADTAPQAAQFLVNESREPRLSLPDTTQAIPRTLGSRADTLPDSLSDIGLVESKDGNSAFVTSQSVVELLNSFKSDILLLDVRVSTHYAKSRIAGALNLCIPTTLLKRPSYNPQKLAETFKAEEQRKKFERWRSCKYIVVYDGNSSKVKDAAPCAKMLEKFSNEGFTGALCIIRGGFADFSAKAPALVSHGSAGAIDNNALASSGGPALPPVIGGCPIPMSKTVANPFFGNIRQNMDLIGGVGQIPLQHPSSMSSQQEDDMPLWLQASMDSRNDGKIVSDKFLHIEQMEQKRMQDALSDTVAYGSPNPGEEKAVQLAGIEKGAKNRYNNIWPYEHSRVIVQGVPKGNCDYFNANHIHAEESTKHYIATQGPIPATFTDFWKVVWQQDARVIVMLTAEKEGGQLKAHNYWDAKRYGPFNLNFMSERRASLEPSRIRGHNDNRRPGLGPRRSTNPQTDRPPHSRESSSASTTSDAPYVTVRKFTLSHSEEPFTRMREITQLHYSHWPDFGAPAHPRHLLGLVEQCNAVVRASYGSSSDSRPHAVRPVVVHCSAGCGRTGTFCTVDSVIDILKHRKRDEHGKNQISSPAQRGVRHPTPMDIDATSSFPPSSFFQVELKDNDQLMKDDSVDVIEQVVSEFRLQRLSMVQSLRQYVLCYETVLEWLCEQSPKSA